MGKESYNGAQAESKELARLCPANTAEATLYTVAGRGVADAWITVINITGTAATITVALLAGGGTTGNEDYIALAFPLPARGRRTWPIGGLVAPDVIKVTSGTANAVTCKLHGKDLGL